MARSYTTSINYPSMGLDVLDEDNFETYNNDFVYVPKSESNKNNSLCDLLCCDVCDPLHSTGYYNLHPSHHTRQRACLPRIFYCVAMLQIATLIAATLTVTGDVCGLLPGNLVGSTTTTTTTTTAPPSLHPTSNKNQQPTLSKQAAANAALPHTLLLQLGENIFRVQPKPSSLKAVSSQPPSLSKPAPPPKNVWKPSHLHIEAGAVPSLDAAYAAAPTSTSSIKSSTTSSTKSSTTPSTTSATTSTSTLAAAVASTTLPPPTTIHSTTTTVEDGSLSSLEASLRHEWSSATKTWSTMKSDIKTRVVGVVRPLNIDCERCEKNANQKGALENFRPFSIVMGAVLPIFLATVIIIVFGVSAMSNYVMTGSRYLWCYTLLCVFISIFSFHFCVVQNVTALRLLTAWNELPMERTVCRNIVHQQIIDHQRSDILWALHSVANIFSAMISMVGLIGCHDLHDNKREIVRVEDSDY